MRSHSITGGCQGRKLEAETETHHREVLLNGLLWRKNLHCSKLRLSTWAPQLEARPGTTRSTHLCVSWWKSVTSLYAEDTVGMLLPQEPRSHFHSAAASCGLQSLFLHTVCESLGGAEAGWPSTRSCTLKYQFPVRTSAVFRQGNESHEVLLTEVTGLL